MSDKSAGAALIKAYKCTILVYAFTMTLATSTVTFKVVKDGNFKRLPLKLQITLVGQFSVSLSLAIFFIVTFST